MFLFTFVFLFPICIISYAHCISHVYSDYGYAPFISVGHERQEHMTAGVGDYETLLDVYS